jgi:hypothetical protein
MMGHQQVEQAALFYEFSLERQVPADHLLRSIDRFVELDGLRRERFYSVIGRPSIAPELMIRMLLVRQKRGPLFRATLSTQGFLQEGINERAPRRSDQPSAVSTVWYLAGCIGWPLACSML